MHVIFFGDPQLFSIRFDKDKNEPKYKILHLCILNQILGDVDEPCYFPTWISSIKKLYLKIKIGDPNFSLNEEMSNIELFNLIQNSKNDMLPTRWNHSIVTIDETLDSWLVFFSSSKEKIRFLWQGLKSPCPQNLIGEVFSLVIEKDKFLKALEDLFLFFNEEIPR